MDLQKNDQKFLGHPRGLATLFFTEMWERFSYYGMRAILLYYMYYAVSRGGLGFDKPLAASIMSIYGALVYVSSVFGGFISDRILGSRRTVFIGGVLIMFGHICLATPFGRWALFVSIALIVIGTGLLKPNISEMVGQLYQPNDPRRDTGFTIFVFGINLGAFISPIIVGYLGQQVNFHLGFSLAAVGMFIGLAQYYFDGKKYLSRDSLYPTDPLEPEDFKKLIRWTVLMLISAALILIIMQLFELLNLKNLILVISIITLLIPLVYFVIIISSNKITTVEHTNMLAYIPLFVASILFWTVEEQGSVILALFANEQTRLSFFGLIQFPASFFQSMNPFFIMCYVPFFAILWTRLGKKQPSAVRKFSYGLFFAGLSFLWMMLPGLLFGTVVKVSPFWLIMSWALVIIGEILISPTGLSVTTKLAPKAFQSQMMSMWFLSDAAGQAINSQLVRFYTKVNEVYYFGFIGTITIIFGLFLLLSAVKIEKLVKDL
jgi:POT family proton-dependent oligopeptide transporter